MDDFEEKKWFVYLGDRHEGPFSLAEIQGKMAGSEVTPSSFVWAEGMEDWKQMTEVPAFASLISPAPAEPQPEPQAAPEQSPDHHSEPTPVSIELEEHPSPLQKKNDKKAASAASDDSGEKKPSPRLWRTLFFLILLLGGGLGVAYFQGYLEPVTSNPAVSAALRTVSDTTQPLLLKLTDKYPSLSRWISPIPTLDDVSPADYDELRSAASTPLDKEGPKIALALSTQDPQNPSFYIASNLPDGTVINIHIEGVAETLIGQLSSSASTQVTLSHKLGKSAPVKLADNQPVPRGQYEIYALESEKQPPEATQILSTLQPLGSKLPAWAPAGFKLLATKSYFLGGMKDSVYASRLKEFHDKLQKKATDELTEIRQFAMTLESELGATQSKFKALHKPGKAQPAKKKAWEEFRTKEWMPLQAQLSAAFEKWTPATLEKDFFYGMLYLMVQQTQKSLENVHAIQNSYFAGTSSDASTFEIQVGQAASVAESSIAALKAKIEQAAKISPSPNGMPRKDGL